MVIVHSSLSHCTVYSGLEHSASLTAWLHCMVLIYWFSAYLQLYCRFPAPTDCSHWAPFFLGCPGLILFISHFQMMIEDIPVDPITGTYFDDLAEQQWELMMMTPSTGHWWPRIDASSLVLGYMPLSSLHYVFSLLADTLRDEHSIFHVVYWWRVGSLYLILVYISSHHSISIIYHLSCLMMAHLVLLHYVHIFCTDVERCEEFTDDLLFIVPYVYSIVYGSLFRVVFHYLDCRVDRGAWQVKVVAHACLIRKHPKASAPSFLTSWP